MTVDHLISDAWSTAIILQKMSEYYRFSLEGKLEYTQPLPAYQDYVEYQQKYKLSERYIIDESYWKKKLANSLNSSRFYQTNSSTITTRNKLVSYDLGEEFSQQIKTIVNRKGLLSPAIIFSTILFVYLHRLSGEEILRMGSTFSNRSSFKETIGLFINTCALQVEITSKETFISLARKVQIETLEAAKHQNYPVRNTPINKAYDVLFNYHNVTFTNFCGLPMEFNLNYSRHASERLILQVQDFNALNRFVLDFHFNCDAFNEQQRQRSVKHFVNLLKAFIGDSNQLIHQASMLTTQERNQLIVEWNHTQTEYPQELCIHQLFEAQEKKTPEAVAVEFEGQQLTYQQLNSRANQLAHHLQKLGVTPEVLVGICLERSLDLVVALLAILKAGGAYVPLDPFYPQERLAYMLEDAEVQVVLTQQQWVAHLQEHVIKHESTHLLCLDRDSELIAKENNNNPASGVKPENLAYLIYTSGSTGKPKGVQIPHQSVVNFLTSMSQRPGLTAKDIMLAVTSISFDIAGLELYLPLMVGARVVVASREVATFGPLLAKLIKNSGATIMQATPATWYLLLAAGWEGKPRLKILCGGEALSPELAKKLQQKASSLWNMYGPTETTIWSTLYQVSSQSNLCRPSQDAPELIGRPIANTQIYILDYHLQPVPIGVTGELYIGGAGLARGYRNRPQLNQQKFITSPVDKSKLYKTGDLARYLPDGNIEFLGRIDNQVKIRGFRIELGEIEAALAKHPQVWESVVVARQEQPGDKRLVAYIVPQHEQKLATDELCCFLKQKLPYYMVPSAFVLLEALPLTPNGKINRRALPAPKQSPSDLLGTLIAPRTPVEQKLAEIWSEVLHLERVGIDDNFFELGGNSLLATQVISRLSKTLGIELSLHSLFESPTIAELAECIETVRWLTQQQQAATDETISDYEGGKL
ncbi:MAG: amino acid adenylation domain-containing protein [Symploca sp. SIO1C4]|uniref:Amino acid adenylation domain-containing protein n=1 Tax=Symploca sp. SIO1C4 TaxID=2607765 RepID=A0A6B3NPF2_9CYAN|nr:amino acid adenylation domain-containing protein [Symploca sp. SIO1C4]